MNDEHTFYVNLLNMEVKINKKNNLYCSNKS